MLVKQPTVLDSSTSALGASCSRPCASMSSRTAVAPSTCGSRRRWTARAGGSQQHVIDAAVEERRQLGQQRGGHRGGQRHRQHPGGLPGISDRVEIPGHGQVFGGGEHLAPPGEFGGSLLTAGLLVEEHRPAEEPQPMIGVRGAGPVPPSATPDKRRSWARRTAGPGCPAPGRSGPRCEQLGPVVGTTDGGGSLGLRRSAGCSTPGDSMSPRAGRRSPTCGKNSQKTRGHAPNLSFLAADNVPLPSGELRRSSLADEDIRLLAPSVVVQGEFTGPASAMMLVGVGLVMPSPAWPPQSVGDSAVLGPRRRVDERKVLADLGLGVGDELFGAGGVPVLPLFGSSSGSSPVAASWGGAGAPGPPATCRVPEVTYSI